MGDISRRLDRLEGCPDGPENTHEREKWRSKIRQEAERLNDARRREELEPVFEITESGDVLCVHDGKPVTTFHQTLAEDWYRRHLAWGRDGHDEETEAFYTPEGELALSRTHCDLARTFRLYRED